jgi:hypothetical protein
MKTKTTSETETMGCWADDRESFRGDLIRWGYEILSEEDRGEEVVFTFRER